jgi:hypothetical protein
LLVTTPREPGPGSDLEIRGVIRRELADGKSPADIAAEFQREGRPLPAGVAAWDVAAVERFGLNGPWSQPLRPSEVRTLRFLGTVGALLGAVGISYIAGTPKAPLPGIAFGWPLLFHVLRAAAVLGAVGAVLLVCWRATHGQFPIKFGNLEYAETTASEVKSAVTAQEARLRRLEDAPRGLGATELAQVRAVLAAQEIRLQKLENSP